jgi:hypothetical protein
MGWGPAIYVPSFIKFGSATQKLIAGIYRQIHTQRATWSHKPAPFLASILYFWKNRVGLWDYVAVCVSPLIIILTPEPISIKIGTYIMAPEPISTEWLNNPPSVAKQRLSRNVTATKLYKQQNNCWTRFQCVRCHITESRRLGLPRTTCFQIRKVG